MFNYENLCRFGNFIIVICDIFAERFFVYIFGNVYKLHVSVIDGK